MWSWCKYKFDAFSIYKKLCLREVKPTTITLQLVNRFYTYPRGILDDVLVKVDKLVFSVDFIVLDIEEHREIPIIRDTFSSH